MTFGQFNDLSNEGEPGSSYNRVAQSPSLTSMFPILDLVFQFASFGFSNMKLALQNKQIGIPN